MFKFAGVKVPRLFRWNYWRNQVRILDYDRAGENLERRLEEQSERDCEQSRRK